MKQNKARYAHDKDPGGQYSGQIELCTLKALDRAGASTFAAVGKMLHQHPPPQPGAQIRETPPHPA